jgi:hypothetical protein
MSRFESIHPCAHLFGSTVQAYLDTQNKFISIYHAANELWSEYCAAEFGRKLIHMLEIEQWNDLNTTAVLWQRKQRVSDYILCSMLSRLKSTNLDLRSNAKFW